MLTDKAKLDLLKVPYADTAANAPGYAVKPLASSKWVAYWVSPKKEAYFLSVGKPPTRTNTLMFNGVWNEDAYDLAYRAIDDAFSAVEEHMNARPIREGVCLTKEQRAVLASEAELVLFGGFGCAGKSTVIWLGALQYAVKHRGSAVAIITEHRPTSVPSALHDHTWNTLLPEGGEWEDVGTGVTSYKLTMGSVIYFFSASLRPYVDFDAVFLDDAEYVSEQDFWAAFSRMEQPQMWASYSPPERGDHWLTDLVCAGGSGLWVDEETGLPHIDKSGIGENIALCQTGFPRYRPARDIRIVATDVHFLRREDLPQPWPKYDVSHLPKHTQASLLHGWWPITSAPPPETKGDWE